MFKSPNIYVLCFILAQGISTLNASQMAVKVKAAEATDTKKAAETAAMSMIQLDAKQLAELKDHPSKFDELTIQHDNIVTAVAINKQKTLIAIGDRIGNTYVRDLKTNKIITILFNDDLLSSVRCIKFHPTRNVVVVGYAHRSNEEQTTGEFAFGKYMVTFKKTKQFLVWFDLDTPQQVHLNGHSDWVNDVDFSPDGSMLASIADDCTVVLWDTIFKEVMHTFITHEGYGRSVSFNADGTMLASAAFDGKVNVYDVAKVSLLWSKKMNQNSKIKCCTNVGCPFLNFTDPSVALFHPTQPSALAFVGTDNDVALIDVRDQKKITGSSVGIKDKTQGTARPYFKWISALAFNANGSKLSCMHDCGSLTTWHLNKKDKNITWASVKKGCHVYGSMACVNDTVYAGYGCTSDEMEKFKQERNTAPGFVLKWNTDINQG